jgi:hypothetical protein
MKRKLSMERSEKWSTTLGELIVALTDEVGGFVSDEKKTYAMVAMLLAHICKDPKPLALLSDQSGCLSAVVK